MIDKLTFKEKLIQYCDIKKETENLKKRIERLQKQSSHISDVVQNGYKRHAVISGYDIKRQHKLDILKAVLQAREDTLLDIQTEVETFIDRIPKSNLRNIFTYRYIEGMSWIQIQHEMKYNDESKARKKHDIFLEKIA